MVNIVAIFFAKYVYLIVIGIALIYGLLQPRPVQKKMLILSIICLPLIFIVAKIASHFFYDPRPFVVHHIKPLIPHASDNGFPSDHTLISAAFASVLYVFTKKWGIIAGVLAILVGLSRIYAQIHSPIDILGSIVISVVVVWVVTICLHRYTRLLV